MGRVFRRGTVFWIAYFHRGQEIRESTKSDREVDARRLLKQRLAEVQLRQFVGPQEDRVTFEDLEKGYVQDYELRRFRSLDTARLRARHLAETFGTMRAVDITTVRIRQYQACRRAQGAEAATVNRETTALARMFRLAVKSGILSRVPVFPDRLEENPPRQGFFEHAEYLAIRAQLPADYQDVLDFAYFSGWRRREITRLEWHEVDTHAAVVRLSPARSKNKTGRVLPLQGTPLADVLMRRQATRRLDVRLVFHVDGKPIGDWRKTWTKACKRAGLPGKYLHDCRRTAARNLIRAGVPERVAMMLTGHKTRNVFDRYNIVSESDLSSATERLAHYVRTQSTTPRLRPWAATGTGGDQ
jgi:integrase